MIAAAKKLFFLLPTVALSVSLQAQSYEQLGMKQQYFPKGVFAQGRSDGDFVAGWYSSQLQAMKEPSLSTSRPPDHAVTYRFTWLRTFHHPLIARFVLDVSGAGTLYVKLADGAGGYQPGKVIVDSTFPLKRDEVQEFCHYSIRWIFGILRRSLPMDRAGVTGRNGYWRVATNPRTTLSIDGLREAGHFANLGYISSSI